jgi:hypothetical protein
MINKIWKFILFRVNLVDAWIRDEKVRGISSRLKELEGRYSGERCFIMGNGPSLNEMDLGLLKDDQVWGFNRCYLLFDRIEWRPSFYVSVDTRVVPDNADEISGLFKSLTDTKFFFPKKFRVKGYLGSSPNVYWYHEKKQNKRNLPYSYFSLDPSKYVRSVRTVTIAGIQLAVYLGFNPIYLIGCDTDYEIPDDVMYEDEAEEEIVSLADNDINHFDPEYFGKEKKYHQPFPERMIFHYHQVKQVCDQQQVEIYNATVGGKLEVFPRVDYKDLF